MFRSPGDLWSKIIEYYDERIAELEPIAFQQLGSKEQRLAFIELAYAKVWRERAAKGLKRATEKLKPTK